MDWTQDEIDDDQFEEYVEPEFDCHADFETGFCGLAGSEDCEFECPHRSEVDRIRARHAARNAPR